jgi:hypothetical protein
VKTIIKLLIAAVILNGLARVGMAAMKYYQLKDETQQLITFGANTTPNDLQNHIISKAEELKVPVDPNNIIVTRDGLHTYATVSYSQQVEVVPNYTYPIKFHFTADSIALGGLTATRGGIPVVTKQ